ncbi:MAG: FliG C-terminal domain-containing protein [Planctomycetota bacterium]|jgi:flagellar motor switch protein FliG
MQLTGAQKAAMLVMSLKEEQAAALLRNMSDSSLAKLRKAAESLDVGRIGDDEKRQALRSFFAKQRRGGFFLGDADERFRKVLARAKGEEGIRQIYAEEEAQAEAEGEKSPLEFVEDLPEEQVASVLSKESPRCAAVLLGRLSGEKAGRILNLIEEEQRESIVGRIIATENVPPEVAEEVLAGFRERLEEMGPEAEVASEERRARELASMIATLDKESQERVLSQINERDPEMAEVVERLIFGFGDLIKVSGKSMQELLRKCEDAQIAMALKGAPKDIEEHFKANMSQRARERVEEEREMAGRVPVSEVEAAREEIMKVARRMYRDGDLVVEMGDEQYVE